jgi:fibronectin type 3 domain-containing protein
VTNTTHLLGDALRWAPRDRKGRLSSVKAAVWALAGILALDIFLLAVLGIVVGIRRYRAERLQRRLERVWRVPKLPSAATTRRDRGRKVSALVIAAVLTWAFFGVSGLRADRMDTSALGSGITTTQTATEPRGGPANDGADARGGPVSQQSAGASVATADPATAFPPTTSGSDQGAPSTVAAIPASSTVIRLLWTGVSRANGYEVQRSNDGATWVSIASTDPDTTAYRDAGLASGTTYFYRVLAVTDGGATMASDAVSATTAAEPLSAPTLTTVSASSTEIDLVWNDVSDETGYRIERSADGTSGWTAIATTGQDVTTYVDTGLSPSTTYSYRVVAVNVGSESPPSNVSSATTAAEPPPGPGQPGGAADATPTDAASP